MNTLIIILLVILAIAFTWMCVEIFKLLKLKQDIKNRGGYDA